MGTTLVSFKNRDGQSLSGRLEMPVDGRARAYAVFAHCFTCGKSIPAAVRICRELARVGIGTLRFDFTGLDESEGEFGKEGFQANVGDLKDAAAYLGERYQAPQLLVGHSLGGTAALQAAREIESVRAVCTIGAPGDPAHALNMFEDDLESIRERGQASVTLAGRTFNVSSAFVEDFEAAQMKEAIAGLRRALLILHSPIDNVVGIDHAANIFTAAKHPKSFVSLDDADHMLTDKDDTAYAASVIAAWASRYIDGDARELSAASRDAGTVVEIGRDRYLTRIQSRHHTFPADEPESLGGTDEGPTPYELLLAALGACTTITLRMYADRKEWPLDAVRVHLKHDKIHAKDCEDCETETGKVDVIERTLRLTGKLDDEQRQRLVEIADKCPVHKLLHNEVKVETTLDEEGD